MFFLVYLFLLQRKPSLTPARVVSLPEEPLDRALQRTLGLHRLDRLLLAVATVHDVNQQPAVLARAPPRPADDGEPVRAVLLGGHGGGGHADAVCGISNLLLLLLVPTTSNFF